MKVVHINMSRNSGGAAIAASRHCEAMRKEGIDASMLTLEDVIGGSPLRRFKYNFCRFIQFKLNGLYKAFGAFSYMMSGFDLSTHPLVSDADEIWIHWVDDGLLNVSGVRKLLDTGKPVYWFMHDMFPMTGGCHYSMDCGKYRTECGDCPLLARRRHLPDPVSRCFRRKLVNWEGYDNLKVLCPSQWLADCASSSRIFGGCDVMVRRNVLDTAVFRPTDHVAAKEKYFPGDSRKVILFAAESISNPYKGWRYMKECLNRLNPDRYVCLVLGSADDSLRDGLGIHTVFTGKVTSTDEIVCIYNAADVFVTTTLADNYPNVLLEAVSCGLKCVGFDSGGVGELVRNGETGYLAVKGDVDDLMKGIETIIG